MPTDIKWIVILIIVVVAVGTIGLAVADGHETEKMKACVAAGMEWVQDFGNYYECRDS